MRRSVFTTLLFLVVLGTLIISCNKKVEVVDTDYQKERLTELIMPLEKGKYITYRLDSTVFTNFGRNTEIHSYLVKHIVDTSITDNLGRPGYRIYTYLSDTTGTQPWQPNGTYSITLLDDHVEVIEDNMRVIKLVVPVRDGTQWKGNNYLAEDPYGSEYSFSNDDNMADWEFHFDGPVQSTVTVQDQTYNDVYTITETMIPTRSPILLIMDRPAYHGKCIQKTWVLSFANLHCGNNNQIQRVTLPISFMIHSE